jgi:hypothetical protein
MVNFQGTPFVATVILTCVRGALAYALAMPRTAGRSVVSRVIMCPPTGGRYSIAPA